MAGHGRGDGGGGFIVRTAAQDAKEEDFLREMGYVRKLNEVVERRAKQRAPVDTGALRSSINTVIEGDVYSAMAAEVGTEVNYGVFVELGTERMAPQPYLGPAFDEVEPSFVQALQQISPLGGGGIGGGGAPPCVDAPVGPAVSAWPW